MDYSWQINEKWASFGGRARQEVDADLGSGSVFRLIGRGGIIFCRGPFCWELNADAREAGGIYLKEIAAWCFLIELKNTVQKLTRHSCDLTVKRRLFIRDRHAMYIVKKRLNEGEGKYRQARRRARPARLLHGAGRQYGRRGQRYADPGHQVLVRLQPGETRRSRPHNRHGRERRFAKPEPHTVLCVGQPRGRQNGRMAQIRITPARDAVVILLLT